MTLPIIAYGSPILRQPTEEINADYPQLAELVSDMYETMAGAHGVGLAAPQIGLPLRLLVIGLDALSDDYPEYKGFTLTMINPRVLELSGKDLSAEEGCLSLPGINENVMRKERVRVCYQDLDFNQKEEEFSGYLARVIQHEYDHIEGKLFIDHISPIRKQLIKGKLGNIQKRKVSCRYRIK